MEKVFNYVKEKFKFYERGHLGHSISMGPQTAEAPFISLSEKRKLEETERMERVENARKGGEKESKKK